MKAKRATVLGTFVFLLMTGNVIFYVSFKIFVPREITVDETVLNKTYEKEYVHV